MLIGRRIFALKPLLDGLGLSGGFAGHDDFWLLFGRIEESIRLIHWQVSGRWSLPCGFLRIPMSLCSSAGQGLPKFLTAVTLDQGVLMVAVFELIVLLLSLSTVSWRASTSGTEAGGDVLQYVLCILVALCLFGCLVEYLSILG